MPNSGLKSFVIIAVCIAALIGGLVGGGLVALTDEDEPAQTSNNRVIAVSSSNIKNVLRTVEPAVVSINTNSVGGGEAGTGSGMILTPDGEVLTNAHVVAGGTSFSVVRFGKNDELPADLIGLDQANDVALLKIRNAKNLPTVKLGSSDAAEVGDPVVAIGNALALAGGPSVTTGIVSAKNRSVNTQQEKLSGLIQTDAAINFGNSGGPLVDFEGRVIGINTATADPSFSQNIGFALAIDNVKPLIRDLRTNKATSNQALLGVTTVTLTNDIKEQYSLDAKSGAVVDEVSEGSPAADIDLQRLDVITKLGATKIESSEDLLDAVRSHKPGDKVTVTWIRDGRTMSKTAELVARPVN